MMDLLTDILDIVNCVFQGVIAISAMVAIRITLRQISGTGKVNLKMKTEFRLNETQDGIELVIHMVNLGLAPIFISAAGVQLCEGKKSKFQMNISNDSFVLNSGQSKSVCGLYNSEMIDDKALLNDRVRIYVVCQMDKFFYEKEDCSYNEFKHECDKINKRVNKLT